MSRRSNCDDNAHASSIWSRFNAELLDGGSFPGLAEVKFESSHHIAYYNAEQRHFALGYHSLNYSGAQVKTTSHLCPAAISPHKAVLCNLVRTLAAELVDRNICVNSIHPGVID
jgi:NAD(P)-dependent dehydrogenase (short-subunit alcohol dehydrogenase family)